MTKETKTKISHLADFLGAELRRRYEEFEETRVMVCWDCIGVILNLAKEYNLHWDKVKREYAEEEDVEV